MKIILNVFILVLFITFTECVFAQWKYEKLIIKKHDFQTMKFASRYINYTQVLFDGYYVTGYRETDILSGKLVENISKHYNIHINNFKLIPFFKTI